MPNFNNDSLLNELEDFYSINAEFALVQNQLHHHGLDSAFAKLEQVADRLKFPKLDVKDEIEQFEEWMNITHGYDGIGKLSSGAIDSLIELSVNWPWTIAGKNARVVIEILSGQSCYIPPYYGGTGTLRRSESNETIVDSGFEFFPNPCGDYLIVNLGPDQNSDLRVELFDESGKLSITTAVQSLQGQMILDTRSLPEGIYQIRLIGKTGPVVLNETIVKIR